MGLILLIGNYKINVQMCRRWKGLLNLHISRNAGHLHIKTYDLV